MSFLNGISGLGSGLGAFAADAMKEQLTPVRAPLLNATPPAASAESTPAAAPPAASASATPAAPGQAAAAITGGGSVNVPAALLPIYQAASKRTGIPVDVLVAQARQESDFNPNAVGSAGEIGLHQIKPSTARDPGWGLRGIDPATLKDPAVNINFAADYLKARAGSQTDFGDTAAVDAALAAYNGGGDRNYVANVRRHMGAA